MEKIFTFKNKRHMPGWIACILKGFLHLWAWTFRVKMIDPEGVFRDWQFPASIITFWHNRMLFIAHFLPKAYRSKISVLVSHSRDGEYMNTLLHRYGYQVVRGSSSRGGFQALRELSDCLKSGQSLSVTPDGPRGPMYQPHAGVAFLSMHCGNRIVPVSINASSYWELHSWDRLQIPKPFCRITIRIGKPYSIARKTPVEESCRIIREALMEITEDRQPAPAEKA